MATFYILPPKAVVAGHLAKMVEGWLPGAAIDKDSLLEILAAQQDASTFVIHRDDLPDGLSHEEAVREHFGAEAGDRVVSVSSGVNAFEPRLTKMDRVRTAA